MKGNWTVFVYIPNSRTMVFQTCLQRSSSSQADVYFTTRTIDGVYVYMCIYTPVVVQEMVSLILCSFPVTGWKKEMFLVVCWHCVPQPHLKLLEGRFFRSVRMLDRAVYTKPGG